MKLDWEPTAWLTVSGGLRYQSYWTKDDFARDMRRAGYPFRASAYGYYGVSYWPRREGVTDEEIADYRIELEEQGLSESAIESLVEREFYPKQVYVGRWYPDHNGKYHRADNPLLNGSLDGIDYRSERVDGGSSDIGSTITSDYITADVAEKRSDSNWAPSFSTTLHLGDYGRMYFLFNQLRRYPSMFESTLNHPGL